jgi:hypothetical protein
MKKQLSNTFFVVAMIVIVLSLTLMACTNSNETKLVDWKEAKMYELPQQVIDFYYNTDTSSKNIFAVLDSNFVAEENFFQQSSFSETHYVVQINHQPINIRERDFRAPFLIFNGRLYYSKSLILKGKLMTPQDLFIYYVDLKTVLK